jgi:hypothetical protein
VAARRDEHIGRFEVAVHDALRVRRVECIGHFDSQLEELGRLEPSMREDLPERLAFEQLHDDIALPLVVADVVKGADVRVVQRGCGAGLPLEAVSGVRVV